MMSTAPPLSLTREQTSNLQTYLQNYRRSAFASLPPSFERNATLRFLQRLQGTLIDLCDRQKAPFQLVLTAEEMATFIAILKELLTLYGAQPNSPERNKAIAELADLKVHCLAVSPAMNERRRAPASAVAPNADSLDEKRDLEQR